MKVKVLKEYLAKYEDEKELVIKSESGLTWEINEQLLSVQNLTDEKREVCKFYIK